MSRALALLARDAREFFLGLLENSGVGVGAIPLIEPLLIGREGEIVISGAGMGSREMQARHGAGGEIPDGTAIVENFLKFLLGPEPVLHFEIGDSAKICGIESGSGSEWRAVSS